MVSTLGIDFILSNLSKATGADRVFSIAWQEEEGAI
jgi:hypothetical protein